MNLVSAAFKSVGKCISNERCPISFHAVLVCVYIIDKKLNFTTLMPGKWNAFAAIIAKCGATADACTQLDKLDLNAHWHWYSWNCRHFSLELQERVDPVPALLESLEEFLEMSGKFQMISQITKCTKNGFNTFVF